MLTAAHKVSLLLWLLTSAFLLLIMIVSFSDVTMRTFATPIPGAYEVTEIAVGAMIFAALPIVTLRNAHVSVTLLSGLKKRFGWFRWLVVLVSRGTAAIVFIYLGYRLWGLGNEFDATGAKAIFASFPLAPFAWFAAIMCWLSALAGFVAAFEVTQEQES